MGSKKVRKNEVKKGLVLRGQKGTLGEIVVGSLWAGGNKGETWLPPGGLVEQKNHF